ncbi:hypothetical protein LWI29_002042 [Acer saccharum]|uniref:Uncharacterized protein n=1 Tax=Acer saccharum TaxID=4024 RepID=A0AA39RVL6_ACESA|nr:hypothetical protein LWI29_002042 [Acer saccharum]
MLTEIFGSSKFSFDKDGDLKFSSVIKDGIHFYYEYKERMKGSNPLIILGMDIGYNRMGLAVSNDIIGGFEHVGVLDTKRFRKALKFIELASDARTSVDLVEATKRAAIESFKLAKQLDGYINEYNVNGALMSYPVPHLNHVHQRDYFDSREYACDFIAHVGRE